MRSNFRNIDNSCKSNSQKDDVRKYLLIFRDDQAYTCLKTMYIYKYL